MVPFRTINKLKILLESGIQSEAELIYLLVEVRKILELTGETNKYKFLNFHCNWVLHSHLDRGVAREILDRFNEVHLQFKAGIKIERLPENLRQTIEGVSSMDQFRAELDHFLSRCSLPKAWLGNFHSWSYFLRVYTNAIKDSPLIIKTALSNFSLIKMSVEYEFGENAHRVNWILTDKDGTQGAVFVMTTSNPSDTKAA